MDTNTTNKKKVVDKVRAIQMKNVIKAFTLIWGLVLIILMTVTNVGIKKDFDLLAWISNSLILFGIMIFGLLMGETIGLDKQKENKVGLYQTTLREYNEYFKGIENNVIYFDQFYQWYMPKELYNKKLNYLIMKGVEISKAKQIIEHCVIEDLYELKSHAIKKNDIYIRKLNDYEVIPVEKVLKGDIKLNLSQPNYYLTAFGDENTGSILEEGKEIAKLRKSSRRNKRLVKVISTLTISLVWGLLTVYDFMNGDDTQAWFNLCSRITALCTSFVSGWMSSVQDVKYQAQALLNKIRVLTLFKDALDKKLFAILDEDELAKKEYDEYQQKIEEEKKNVITPEVIGVDVKLIGEQYGK